MYDDAETRVHQLDGLAVSYSIAICLGYILHLTVYATPKGLQASRYYSELNEPELNTIREEA
jgi:hypothetical protein